MVAIHIGPLQKIKNIRWSIRVVAKKYKIVEKLGNDTHPKLEFIFLYERLFFIVVGIKKSKKNLKV